MTEPTPPIEAANPVQPAGPPDPLAAAAAAAVDEAVRDLGSGPGQLIPILQAVQAKFHYLPEEALRRICERTETTPADLAGVVSFYSQFRTRPAGQHRIKVCIGTACHVKGADAIHEAFRQHLGIAPGTDTDAERLFTLEKVACLGCCMLAPAVQIDQVIYGFLTPEKAPRVVRDFLATRNGQPKGRAGRELEGDGKTVGEARVCLCSSCAAAGTDALLREVEAQVRRLGLPARVRTVGCTGMAYQAPLLDIAMDDGSLFQYGQVRPRDVGAILRRHFPAGRKGRALAASLGSLLERLQDGEGPPLARFPADSPATARTPFHGPQCRIATEHAGEIPPLDLEAYRAAGGFAALEKALREMTPARLREEIEASGLRGRGGAGYPAFRKWAAVAEAPGERKVIVANGDEGDPGAFMDRMILESFPFRVIEGMAIASRAVGAAEGVLYIRAEYPLALERIRAALDQCALLGCLGDDIFGSGHSFRITVAPGAGAFVCGEETALIAAMEGKRGTPSHRPPYPSEEGLWGLPTLVNNVETFSLVPWIVREGAAAFARHGTAGSKGTKTFALAGKVVRSGLVEVPMGLTIRQVVEEIGGGIPDGKRFKAVQIGGPSGGCVPARLADTPIDYEALGEAGAIMGSGGLVVLDEDDCMVDIARYFMAFTQRESCGKCTFCRVGTRRLLDILDKLCGGRGTPGDLAELEELAQLVGQGSMCGLGKTAPNPVLSTLRHFRDEYEAHAAGRCPAGKCRSIIKFSIGEGCIGCTRCAQRCPVGAIEARPYERHAIDPARCVRCGTCLRACPTGAVKRESGGEA